MKGSLLRVFSVLTVSLRVLSDSRSAMYTVPNVCYISLYLHSSRCSGFKFGVDFTTAFDGDRFTGVLDIILLFRNSIKFVKINI